MTDNAERRAAAKAFIEEAAARKLTRRRAAARLPIGEKFRILEELHEVQADLASIRAASKAPGPGSQE